MTFRLFVRISAERPYLSVPDCVWSDTDEREHGLATDAYLTLRKRLEDGEAPGEVLLTKDNVQMARWDTNMRPGTAKPWKKATSSG